VARHQVTQYRCFHWHLKQRTHSAQALSRIAPELSTSLSTETGDNFEPSQASSFREKAPLNARWLIPYRRHNSSLVQHLSQLVRQFSTGSSTKSGDKSARIDTESQVCYSAMPAFAAGIADAEAEAEAEAAVAALTESAAASTGGLPIA
jgi:hypothetical protein